MKKRILVVDDEARIRHIYSRVIRAAASNVFDVLEASDATQAGEVLVREKVDILLLDLRMPGINGVNFSRIIREISPGTQVIVTSVFSVEQQRSLIPEAREYFDKSQGTLALLDKIASVAI